MRRVEILLLCAVAVPALAQNYDKTDTFEPGKKYTCVPTTDHKGWNCNEAGKSVEVKPKESEAARQDPEPSTESQTPTPPPQPSSRSTLPSYLTNAAANNSAPIGEPPSTVSAAAAHANVPPPAPAFAPPPTKTVPLQPATPKPRAAATPAPTPRPPVKPPVSPRATHPPVSEAASSGGEFMTLPGDHFVVEMGHAASRSELDAVRSATHVPNGDLYEVHLRQNGADAWLLLWGSFDTLDAARAARNTLTSTFAAPGWPRRIAPLQAEARRISP